MVYNVDKTLWFIDVVPRSLWDKTLMNRKSIMQLTKQSELFINVISVYRHSFSSIDVVSVCPWLTFGCVITVFRCNYRMHAEICNYSFYV